MTVVRCIECGRELDDAKAWLIPDHRFRCDPCFQRTMLCGVCGKPQVCDCPQVSR